MNGTNFKKFLEDKSWDFDKDTVERMMEEELKKNPEDINMEFVDACMNFLTEQADSLTETKAEKTVKNKKTTGRIKLNRLLIAAVIITIGISIGITAYSKADNVRISDEYVEIFDDYATIYFSKKNTPVISFPAPDDSSKLYKELQTGGIENIVLPTELYFSSYENLEWYNSIMQYCANFTVDIGGKNFIVTIETFTEKNWVHNVDIQGHFSTSKKIDVNGIDVYLFERYGDDPEKVYTSVSYQIGLTQYSIYCPRNIRDTEEFVKNMN